MAITVNDEIMKKTELQTDYVFAMQMLSDISFSNKLFPKLDRVRDLGDNKYQWELKKIGTTTIGYQTVYACAYIVDSEKGVITWESIDTIGNARVNGYWRFLKKRAVIELTFFTTFSITLPMPVVFRPVVSRFVKHEFSTMIDSYFSNVIEALKDRKKHTDL